jgi:formylmethanofuran dehydrogenase subunit E
VKSRVTLKEGIKFHGHLGPYLVLGILAGEGALKKLGADKYFGLKVKVLGATEKPKSCLIDGLQLSTGATYGKGNIHKSKAASIKIEIKDKLNNTVVLTLKKEILRRLILAKTHAACETLAKRLYSNTPSGIFNFSLFSATKRR